MNNHVPALKPDKLTFVRDFLLMLIGSVLMALSMNIFLVPNKIVTGGASGIAIVLHYLAGFPVGVTILAINIPLFLLAVKNQGRLFLGKTIFATVVLSVVVDVTAFLNNITRFLPVITQDVFMASLYGGILSGLGLGIVLLCGGSTGGSDLAAKMLHSLFPGVSVGNILLIIDVAIVLATGFLFNRLEVVLYAAAALFVSSLVVDNVLQGLSFAKAAFIISSKPKVIAEEILNKMQRGVTGLNGSGMYTGEAKMILMCVVKRYEISSMKMLVKNIDPEAFVILTDVREVLGEGFA